jgi:hypothetical protein
MRNAAARFGSRGEGGASEPFPLYQTAEKRVLCRLLKRVQM